PSGGLVVGDHYQPLGCAAPRPLEGHPVGRVDLLEPLHVGEARRRQAGSGACVEHPVTIWRPCSTRSSSPTGVRSPCASCARAASSASPPSPFIPISTATPCTCAWPTRRTDWAGRP